MHFITINVVDTLIATQLQGEITLCPTSTTVGLFHCDGWVFFDNGCPNDGNGYANKLKVAIQAVKTKTSIALAKQSIQHAICF